MDWRKIAAEDLRRYSGLCHAASGLRSDVEALSERLVGVKGMQFHANPTADGGTSMEDHWINLMVEIDRKKLQRKVNLHLIRRIERGLAALSPTERDILERFYVAPSRDTVEGIMETLHCQKSRVYQLKDEALRKFTLHMYGLAES